MKLKGLKAPLKTLNKQEFSHIFERVKRAQEDFVVAPNMLLNYLNSNALKDRAKATRKTTNFLLEAKRQFFQQKLKNKCLMFAGRGTGFFHSMIKKRNSDSSIPALIKADRSSTSSQDEVILEFTNYYKNLLCTENQVNPISDDIINQGPILSIEDYSFLATLINDDDIKNALFHIGDDKAPGLDGFTAAFFKRNWETIKGDFNLVVHEFFTNGKILKQINHAAIVLIPKVKHAPEAKDFRPISCCNVFYKTIAKIIANKLAVIVPNLVDQAQNAFLEERLMTDYILFAQQIIRKYGRKTCTPRSMLIVDIKKAFDIVSWSFIIDLLKKLGFPVIVINWIKECISTATFSIALNVKLHGFHNSKRGLRQRDPISPYLFVLAMDYLSRAIKATSSNPNFNFHPKCERIGLTHLSFPDDIILFSRGDQQSVAILFDTCWSRF